MPPPPPEEPENDESWMATFADTVTLLMAFFVMLLTFTEFDMPAYEEMTSAISTAVGGSDKQSTTQSLKIDVEDKVYEMQADQVISVGSDEKGVTIELQSNAFFQPGSADILPAAIPVLQKLAETLSSPNYELYNVVVEGHTDDGTINTPRFQSNWELSSARAATVVRMFEANNVARERLRATGYADTRPKVPNLDLEGKPIPENRATNRRVVLRLHPMSLNDRDAYLRAQEFKRRLAEATAAKPAQASQSATKSAIENRLPIQPTPSALDPKQQDTKALIDNLKREFISQFKAGEPKNINVLKEWQLKFDNLASRRSKTLETDFKQIETFLNDERKRLTAKPAS